MNGQRPRGPPPGDMPPPHREPRRVGDPRSGGPGDASLSRAEKFEDEKRRITQSCFAKKESDGTLVESYITHVRITEDAAYPSSPPPPNSPSENRKARVIIVAVRKSGRVRMHKGRENNDGSFSVGKTWMLDDLSSILSYSAWMPSTPLEQQYKQWAGSVGFVVTIGKPYYWHARTSKEKEFFIGSLVKIYKKYTGGKVPNLIGFDDRERQMLVGTAPAGPPGSSRGPVPPPIRPEGPPSSHSSRPQSPYTARAPSRDGPREHRRPPDEQSLRAQRSRDQMQRPSTGQSGKVATPPLSHPPAFPDQPPPRAERRAADKVPKTPPVPAYPEKKYRDPEESSLASSHFDAQPPPSRDGRMPEARPYLRTPGSIPSSPDVKRSTDGLRPTTPGSVSGETRNIPPSPASSLGQKSPLNDANDKVSTPEPSGLSREVESPKISTDIPSIAPFEPVPAGNHAPKVPVQTTAADIPPVEPGPKEAVPEATLPVGPPEPESEPEPEPEPLEEDPEAHRPGLGPMIKKKQTKDLAGAFRKAATAYGAFKPRPGGAGERLMAAAKQQKGDPEEPDGITGVVPAPSLRPNTATQSPVSEVPSTPTLQTPETEVPPPVSPAKETPPPLSPAREPPPPTVEITQAVAEEPATPTIEVQEEPRDTSRSTVQVPVDQRSRSASPSPHDRNRRRREDNTIKYCLAIGIDPKVLDGRGVDFDDILTDLGWNGRLSDEKRIEDLEADVRREIGRVEATSWLGNLEQQEGKVDQLARLIDKTVEECDELDGLLTLYSHELNTLNDDVSYIEAQSQGLQVQTANQKLLQNELQNLLRTLSISPSELRSLKESSLSNSSGLRDTELALSTLYRAMHTIDSDIWQNKQRLVDAAGQHGSVGVYADTEIGQMRAIKEKKEEYRTESRSFLQRLRQFMSIAYKVAEQKRIDAAAGSPKDPMKLNDKARDAFRRELWAYNALTLFAREVSTSEWNGLMQLYEQQAKGPYQGEFRDNIQAWKKASRKLTGEEQELLFTHHDKEKENQGVTGMAARKLTVKRGKTIKAATGLRLSSGEKHHGKMDPCEVFAGTLQETLDMICEEQSFVVHFFHLDSLSTVDFPDLVASAAPGERRYPSFSAKQSHDPDRAMARKVEHIMDEIYSFWPNDMQNLVDWAIQADPLQGIGILFALEKSMSDLDDTNQDFIIHSLQKLHSRLVGLFNRFVDEQIRGIEDTKVKINKRKGVISFMRVFPNFSAAVESMLTHPSQEFCDVRVSVNEAYNRINRAMWESLKFIAKEAPGPPGAAAVGGAGGDPEDKEALNYHILLIENMNHYIEEVDVRNLLVLEQWRDRAHQDMAEHMKLYLDAVIRRPLGKLLEFVEAAEGLMATSTDIANRPSHTRSVAKKVLATYDTKEIRRGIELLKKRVEKHFGDADDPGLSRNLVLKVFGECERRYEDAHDRTRRLLETVYEGQLEQDWRKEDAIAMFRRA